VFVFLVYCLPINLFICCSVVLSIYIGLCFSVYHLIFISICMSIALPSCLLMVVCALSRMLSQNSVCLSADISLTVFGFLVNCLPISLFICCSVVLSIYIGFCVFLSTILSLYQYVCRLFYLVVCLWLYVLCLECYRKTLSVYLLMFLKLCLVF